MTERPLNGRNRARLSSDGQPGTGLCAHCYALRLGLSRAAARKGGERHDFSRLKRPN